MTIRAGALGPRFTSRLGLPDGQTWTWIRKGYRLPRPSNDGWTTGRRLGHRRYGRHGRRRHAQSRHPSGPRPEPARPPPPARHRVTGGGV
ncbi:MAG: hypothetical protein MPL62_12035 [Alphaproteobacteria bacterium]|nr:hypothetical protein [Alphaproteobacteria bacterium]